MRSKLSLLIGAIALLVLPVHPGHTRASQQQETQEGQLPPPVQVPGQDPGGLVPMDPLDPGSVGPSAGVGDPASVLFGDVELSAVLVMDVSGSMRGEKIRDAKQAALEAMARYLTPGLGQQPMAGLPPNAQQAAASASAGAAGTTARTVAGAARGLSQGQILTKYAELVDALEEVQRSAGPLAEWSVEHTREMNRLIGEMDELLKGYVVEQNNATLLKLNPLVEKMHFAISKKVNESLGGGHLYMVSGKKATNPLFGGLHAPKMSDHDAIYIGVRSAEARNRHVSLAGLMYGPDYLRRMDSAMESGEATFKILTSTRERGANYALYVTGGNNDWMRTQSGTNWVNDYVIKKGEVIVLDQLEMGPDTDNARRKLAAALENLEGVSYDKRTLAELGYAQGATSDLERQFRLNIQRQLQGGNPNPALATVQQMDKYHERFKGVLTLTGATLPPELATLEQDIAAAKKAFTLVDGPGLPAGVTPQEVDALMARYNSLISLTHEQAMTHQIDQYNKLVREAFDNRGNPELAARLLARATELEDDIQGALHNYKQLGSSTGRPQMAQEAVASLKNKARASGGGAPLMVERIAERFETQPWVPQEPTLGQAVQQERVEAFGGAAQAEAAAAEARAGGRTVIKTEAAKNAWEAANAGQKLFFVAGVGWITYETYKALNTGDYTFFKEWASFEVQAYAANAMLAGRMGLPATGVGGPVAMAAHLGYAGGRALYDREQADVAHNNANELLTGMTGQNAPVGPGGGFFDSLGVETPTPDELLKRFPEGTHGDLRIEIDPRTRAVTFRRKTYKLGGTETLPEVVETWDEDVETVRYNELLAETQMAKLFDHMRGEFRDAVNAGRVNETGQVATSFEYHDPNNSDLNRMAIANPGGLLTRSEFEFYRDRFEETWGRYTLGQTGYREDDLFAAKGNAFRRMMDAVVQGKRRDMERQQNYAAMTPEQLEFIRETVREGNEIWLDGRKLGVDDVQEMIERRRSERQGALRDAIDRFHKDVPEGLQRKIDVLVGMEAMAGAVSPGDVEFGILAYEGSCDTKFWFHPFSRSYDPLAAAVNSLSPGGSTPMTPALYQARHAIWTEGTGSRGAIILLTDGENDCAESPIEASANIYQRVDPSIPTGPDPAATRTSWWRKLPRVSLAFASSQDTTAQAALQDSAALTGRHRIDVSAGTVSPERRNMPITVSTIGFKVSPAQQAVLDTMAMVGGGISANAEDMTQLAAAFGTAIGAASGAQLAGGGVVGRSSRFDSSTILLLGLTGLAVLLLTTLLAVRSGYRPAFAAGGARVVDARPAGQAAGPRAPGVRIALDLTIEEPDGTSRSADFRSAPVTIGRDPWNDLVLRDPEVSRRHAEIVADNGRLQIVDNLSAAGTYVDGRKVERGDLYAGTEIRLGRTKLVVE